MDKITRRTFVGGAVAAGIAAPQTQQDWIPLFNGRDLSGWRPSENTTSWRVVDGCLTADGPRSHLFYTGPVQRASFKNFELEVEVLARPGANSGVFFHTEFQQWGFPDKGFEIQVNNTAAGDNGYIERKKTGSLYGLRNVYSQIVPDDQWFQIQAAVRGKNIQVRVHDQLLVDYTEPTPAVVAAAGETGRVLGRGTFALQCHDAGSKVMFRNLRVRPLPDALAEAGSAPVVDETFRELIEAGRRNIPLVDYHVHLKEGLTLEQALARSRRDGIQYGIAVNCGKGFPVSDDAGVRAFVESLRGQPVFIAMQAEGREWTQMISRRAAAMFDYIFTDSMTWTDNSGRRMRLWIPPEVGEIADPQGFMETLVERTIGILDNEPVDIYVNPTFLPDVIAMDYDRLWTEERMGKVVSAAARNGTAIEINDRYKLPGPAMIRMAKRAGCKFTFGTNNSSAADLGRSEYGLKMVRDCKLEWQDFFIPGAWRARAIDRKGSALRA